VPGPLSPDPAAAALASQNALPIVPSVADKIVAAGTYVANTGLVTAAPMLNSVVPGSNPSGAGGIEVSLLGDGILVIVQALQVHSWFDRDKWGIWLIIALATAICLVLWHDDLRKGALNAAGTAYKTFSSFGPLNKLGVLSGQTDPPGQSPA